MTENPLFIVCESAMRGEMLASALRGCGIAVSGVAGTAEQVASLPDGTRILIFELGAPSSQFAACATARIMARRRIFEIVELQVVPQEVGSEATGRPQVARKAEGLSGRIE